MPCTRDTAAGMICMPASSACVCTMCGALCIGRGDCAGLACLAPYCRTVFARSRVYPPHACQSTCVCDCLALPSGRVCVCVCVSFDSHDACVCAILSARRVTSAPKGPRPAPRQCRVKNDPSGRKHCALARRSPPCTVTDKWFAFVVRAASAAAGPTPARGVRVARWRWGSVSSALRSQVID